jgi:UDP-2,4-diacetamido-2,4,6-trideoxy-beta-L-altropyranose hydrolase
LAPSPIRSVLFAPASGPDVGGGHVMRCLTFAEALAERGLDCAFTVATVGEALVARFAERPFRCLQRGADSDLAGAASGFDLVVIDDYRIDARHEAMLQAETRRLLVIDDLADRPHLCDILVDPGYGRTAEDYDPWLPATAIRLLGPAYALVRRAFIERRTTRLCASVPTSPQRLFVSFGLSDVEGIAARAVDLIRTVLPDAKIDLALASTAGSLAALSTRAASDPALRIHVDAVDIAELMARADFAIGAGGASAWERSCLGLPSLVVIVADNQRQSVRRLAEDGALLAVHLQTPTFEADFRAALKTIGDRDVRLALRARASALCDGRGADRIAEAVLAL